MKYLKSFESLSFEEDNIFDHVMNHEYDKVKDYLENDGDVDYINGNGESLIFIAVRHYTHKKNKLVDLILEYNPDLTLLSWIYQNTVLMEMLENKDICRDGYVKKILEKEPRIINEININNYSPLIMAAIFEYGDSLFEILEFNPDWYQTVKSGEKDVTFIDILSVNKNKQTLDKIKELYPEKYKRYFIEKQAKKFNI